MEFNNNQQQHQESKTDPLSISQLNISSSPSSLQQANTAKELLKSYRHSVSPNDDLPSKETWEESLDVVDDDSTDPNYDSIEGNGHTDPTTFDADLCEYKKKAMIIIEEYFSTNDAVSVANELKDLGTPEYRYYFVKKLISTSMDRHDKEKEMAAFLLSTLYADVIDPPELYRGFNKLVTSADDLSVDIPDAVDVLAVFVARAIVDDILPPAFLKKQMNLLPDGSKGAEVLRKAEKSYLAAPLHAEVVEKRWGGADNWTAEDVKGRINELLKEYVMSGDEKEAFRCIKALKVPFFHHEIVKRALIMAMERRKAQGKLLELLKEATEVGLINSTQVSKGFGRIIELIEDLSLDIPEARSVLQVFISKAASEGWLCASSLKTLDSDTDSGERVLEKINTSEFKDKVKSIVREYFLSGDALEVVHCLETELGACSSQLLRAVFVKYLITLAMDRKKREKEMACVLLTSLGFPAKDVRRAFSMLVESADDTALDNPVVVDDLGMFLARAVVDEVLAPRDLEELLSQTPGSSVVGEKVVQTANTLLKARLSGERIMRCWGGGGVVETSSPGCTASEVKDKIQVLLDEYVFGGELGEACRCVKELGMPFFHHEVVKKAVVRMIEEDERKERVWELLRVCFESGLVTIYQMTKGFKRVGEAVEDLCLDVPDAAVKFKSCVERGKVEGFLDESFGFEEEAPQVVKEKGSSSSSAVAI